MALKGRSGLCFMASSGDVRVGFLLTWQRFRDVLKAEGERFELAVEMPISESQKKLLPSPDLNICRYELSIGIDPATAENGIFSEKLLLAAMPEEKPVQRQLFPYPEPKPKTILRKTPAKGIKTVINKVSGGNDNFYDETGKGWDHSFKLGPRKSALANLPEDETKFPVATWVKRILNEGIDTVALNSASMRKPSPPRTAEGI